MRDDQPHLTKRQRRDNMARKKEERAIRNHYRKQKQAQAYLTEDEGYVSFASQLSQMGLELKDIPGDGNCLFRALGDQFDHTKNHLQHRLDVVDYIKKNRDDFEPFVEDDVPFDRHIANLRKLGTYAGNDAIVSFARLHKVHIVIHQLNSPCWEIHGTDDKSARQLHISYHNGDHYSSVRKTGDKSNSPPNIRIQVQSGTSGGATEWQKPEPQPELRGESFDDLTDIEDHVMLNTGCEDRELVRQALEECNFAIDNTIMYILQLMQASSGQSFLDDSGHISPDNENLPTDSGAKPKKTPKLSNREEKKLRKVDKKRRATDRHKAKLNGCIPQDEPQDDEVLIQTLHTLKI